MRADDCGRVRKRGQPLENDCVLSDLLMGRQRNAHFLDYKLATASDVPRIDVDWVENPAENGGPRGAKGVGEPPSVPTAGAIGNAIAKVIGARVCELPMTPERVWAARR